MTPTKFLFVNSADPGDLPVMGKSIGIVALGVLSGDRKAVHIYHLGAFITDTGNGSKILTELCYYADKFNIHLSVSAESMPNGRDHLMDSELLREWYKRFGFKGELGLLRPPELI